MIDIEKLKAARELIAQPGGWTQDCFCITRTGKRIRSLANIVRDAICYCAVGALIAEDLSFLGEEIRLIQEAAGFEPGFMAAWNDAHGRTQDEVVAAFDKAIALAEAS